MALRNGLLLPPIFQEGLGNNAENGMYITHSLTIPYHTLTHSLTQSIYQISDSYTLICMLWLHSWHNHLNPSIRKVLYTYILIYSYTHILIYSYTHVLMYSYTHILMHSYTHILIYSYTHILMYSCTRIRYRGNKRRTKLFCDCIVSSATDGLKYQSTSMAGQ